MGQVKKNLILCHLNFTLPLRRVAEQRSEASGARVDECDPWEYLALTQDGLGRGLIIFSLSFIIVLLLSGCVFDSPGKYLVINGQKIQVEVANTEVSQINGLSGREALCASCGMLFVYNNSIQRAFWMKNMNFPLDIIWLRGNKVIGISAGLPPEGEKPLRIYASPEPVDMVLEVNAGFADRNEIKVGDDARVE